MGGMHVTNSRDNTERLLLMKTMHLTVDSYKSKIWDFVTRIYFFKYLYLYLYLFIWFSDRLEYFFANQEPRKESP